MAEAAACFDEDDFIEADDGYYDDSDVHVLEVQDLSVEADVDPELFSYECHTVEKCLSLLQEYARGVAIDLKIPGDVACLLLQLCMWNSDKVKASFTADAQELLLKAHALSEPSSVSPIASSSPPGDCGICFLPLDNPRLNELQATCNHRFCEDCWSAHFIARLDTVPTLAIECLACEAYAGDSFVCEVLRNSAKYLKLFMRLTLARYVREHPLLAWCPGVDCQLVVWAEECAPKQVECSCKAQFCFTCQAEYHAPLLCRDGKTWKERCSADSQSVKYIVANTKPCPKCAVHIEKNGGCNHMVCSHCSHNFCWVCCGAWSEHGTQYYHCSKYRPDTAKERERNVQAEAVKRYFFYFERFQNHRQSIMLEENTRAAVQKSITDRSESEGASGTWIDYQYLAEAFEVLAKSRRALQYTYPYAFYLSQTAPERTLLEYQQSQLEHEIETLSFLIEQAALSDKAAIQLHCLHVKQWRKSLMVNFFKSD